MLPEELARYSRQIILPGFGREAQERLRESRVLVVGLGGLGSPASLYLAAAGVGTLGLADFDRVEAHNLHRQVIHSESSLGQTKLESATRRLRELNRHVHLRQHPEGIRVENALSLFADYDVIVDGSDNFPTRYLVNDAAVLAGKPLVYGSIFQFEGQVSVFDPARGAPCYRCLFPEMPAPGEVPNCAEAGVLGALCGVIGSWQALEAIKLLTGLGEPLRGRLLSLDALAFRPRVLQIQRDIDCPVCGAAPHIRELDGSRYAWSCEPMMPAPEDVPLEITVQEAAERLRGAEPPLLLDVREGFERDIATIAGSTFIPMKEVPARLGELPADRPIIVHCHGGRRSMSVTRFLRDKGYQAQNLGGGIDAWSEEIDPSIPRY